jgi:hypothetical protein
LCRAPDFGTSSRRSQPAPPMLTRAAGAVSYAERALHPALASSACATQAPATAAFSAEANPTGKNISPTDRSDLLGTRRALWSICAGAERALAAGLPKSSIFSSALSASRAARAACNRASERDTGETNFDPCRASALTASACADRSARRSQSSPFGCQGQTGNGKTPPNQRE